MAELWRHGGTLVVLGAGAQDAGVYQRAGKLGYRTIAVGRRPEVEEADEYLAVSARAPERIAAALDDREDVVGVLCTGTDVALPALARLIRRWRLPGQLPDSVVRASVDKAQFRHLCELLGFAGYGWASGRCGPDLRARAQHLRFPTVVKPADGSGVRGVTPCTRPSLLPSAISAALAHSPGGRVQVEEFVGGRDITCTALVQNGHVVFHAVSERTLAPPPLFVTTSHRLPASLPGDSERVIRGMLDEICAETGYRQGALTLDAVLGPDERVYPIDLSIRMPGYGLPEAVESAHGVDVVAAAISIAAGEEPALAPTGPHPAMVHQLSSDRSGTLVDVAGAAEVRAIPEVIDLQLFAEPGERVAPYERADRRLGQVVLSGAPETELRRACAAVRTTLRFRLAETEQEVPTP